VWLGLGLTILITAAARRSFALAIGASILLSPIVWLRLFERHARSDRLPATPAPASPAMPAD
jgi:hypothetical protein